MTYAVFFYNMFLIVAYIVLAVVFFWLYRSRDSKLAFWLLVLFACSFFDNVFFFMKEIFAAQGGVSEALSLFHRVQEAFFFACFPFVIRMITGYFYNDPPTRRALTILGVACLVSAIIDMTFLGTSNTALASASSLLYVWVFLRLIPKVGARGPVVLLVVLASLNLLDAGIRIAGLDSYVLWGKRNLVIEAYWVIYLACGVYMALMLLRTVEEPFVPNADILFRRFLDAYGLSSREGEIVKLLMDGESNQDICNTLFIAMGTVKAHNHNIYQKLGIDHRSQVILRYTDYLEKCAQEPRRIFPSAPTEERVR